MTDEIKPKRKYRRKDEPVMAAAEGADAPPGPPMLTQSELAQLRIFELEAKAARAEAETCRLRKKYFLALLDPKGTVEAEEKRQNSWLSEAKEFALKHETLMARISMRLNLDLSKCAFDTDTGVVMVPDSAKGSS
jgi:hypothetical protein